MEKTDHKDILNPNLGKIAQSDKGETIGTRYSLANVEVDFHKSATIILSGPLPAY